MSWLGASARRIRMDAKGLPTARTARYRERYLRVAEELTRELLSKVEGSVRAVLLDRDIAQGVVPGEHQFPLWVICNDDTLDAVSRISSEVLFDIAEKSNQRLWLLHSTYSVSESLDRIKAGRPTDRALLEGSVVVHDDGLIAGISSPHAEQT